MAYTFTLQRDNISLLALQLINVASAADTSSTIDSNILSMSNTVLNSLLKLWQVRGIIVSKRKIGYLFPQQNQYVYQLGSATNSDNVTNSYVQTTSSATANANAGTITCTSVTGMNVNDNIGIQLDAGTRFWTTISGINTGTKVVTLNANIPTQATSGNTVITYTTKINRPLDIPRATCIDLNTSNKVENEIKMLGYDEYLNIPIKTIAGTKVLNGYYDKQLNNSLPYTSALYLFPNPSSVNIIIAFSYQDAIQDMDNSTDYMDIPQEFLYPLAFNLGCELAYFFGKIQELQVIQPKAEQLFQIVKRSSIDKTPLTIKLARYIRRWS